MTSMKIVQFPKPLTPLVHLLPKFFHPIILDIQFQTNPIPPSPMITNQLKEDIIQRGLLYVIRSFLQVGFRLHYQHINLSGFPLTYFQLAEATLSVFSRLYTHVCAVVQKYHEKSFIYKYSHFKYKLILLPTCFICTT